MSTCTAFSSGSIAGLILILTAVGCGAAEHGAGVSSSDPATGNAGTGGAGPGTPADDGGGGSGGARAGGVAGDRGVAGVPAAYDGTGFVVHEWGTNTIVVGSDGSVQRGLHHEEEDLPPFVYDRVKAGAIASGSSVEVKMETPVLYFYSPAPLTAAVSVDFPRGVLTQWYPNAQSFYPMVVRRGSTEPFSVLDPALDPAFSFSSQQCRDQFGTIGSGLLDWGDVQVLAREGAEAGPDAPIERYTWGHARDVRSNPVAVAGPPTDFTAPPPLQHEQFLFYRGLGNFPLPVHVAAKRGGALSLTDTDAARAVGSVFVLNVGADRGSFVLHAEGIGPGGSLSETAPSLDGAPALDVYADALAAAVTGELDRTGLFHDEAVAMVQTWRRQWFRTPGVRLLYLVPQAFTDEQIPLHVSPAPDQVTRVMMIRVEVITPEQEDTDSRAAEGLATAASDAEAYFASLGRFAEPRLRRALALLGGPAYGEALLAKIATADTSLGAGE